MGKQREILDQTVSLKLIPMDKKIYWASTGILSLLMLFSATMYFFNHEMVVETFSRLGYPTYIIYPLAIAKLLAITAILTKKSVLLKEWAYAGLFFDFVLALSAHFIAKDGEFAPAILAIAALLVSYIYDQKLYSRVSTDHE